MDLNGVDFLVRLPVCERPRIARLRFHLEVGHLERDGLVGLGRTDEVLVLFVPGLDLLLVARHEPVPGRGALLDLGVVHLEQEAALLALLAVLLGHPVPGPADLDCLPRVYLLLRPEPRGGLRVLRGLPRRPLGQVLLVPLALGVREVVPLVPVQGQAQSALVRAEVVAHEVGVLGEVDRLQGELAQSLPPVHVGLSRARRPS
mmetsp:Transcript_4139/g.10620  ORF Transcript_4139/g.10620 Transcript_4139/m.10620 type:complete len:203 (-) Transcript_4139:71-679(-)